MLTVLCPRCRSPFTYGVPPPPGSHLLCPECGLSFLHGQGQQVVGSANGLPVSPGSEPATAPSSASAPPAPDSPATAPSPAPGAGAAEGAPEKTPLWAYPIGCWLALLLPGIPLSLFMVLTRQATMLEYLRMEGICGLIALGLSVLLGVGQGVAWLFRRR